ncbi:Uncharacterised protein [Vibrio cholerae]|nr:Uncharacterised protein [Vibrio cholerae]CSI35251.1 Uncharacterised protein [Vibrio cholerae]CSI66324.1 Uncharacterised protein [Vibrio cholerae]
MRRSSKSQAVLILWKCAIALWRGMMTAKAIATNWKAFSKPWMSCAMKGWATF